MAAARACAAAVDNHAPTPIVELNPAPCGSFTVGLLLVAVASPRVAENFGAPLRLTHNRPGRSTAFRLAALLQARIPALKQLLARDFPAPGALRYAAWQRP